MSRKGGTPPTGSNEDLRPQLSNSVPPLGGEVRVCACGKQLSARQRRYCSDECRLGKSEAVAPESAPDSRIAEAALVGRLKTLEALRDRLARALDQTTNPGEVGRLTDQLLGVMDRIEQVENPGGSSSGGETPLAAVVRLIQDSAGPGGNGPTRLRR